MKYVNIYRFEIVTVLDKGFCDMAQDEMEMVMWKSGKDMQLYNSNIFDAYNVINIL